MLVVARGFNYPPFSKLAGQLQKTHLSCRAISSSKFRNKANHLEYRVRLAQMQDIPAISQCNMESLPENYTPHFYMSFLARFPRLSFVAETTEHELVGYALGKIESDSQNNLILPIHADMKTNLPVYYGHVTSIAVHAAHRGNGVATQLMKCLHYNLVKEYEMDSVSLYVRSSNVSAQRMYEKVFKYELDHIVPQYYLDREDAYYMIRRRLGDDSETLLAPAEIELITLHEERFVPSKRVL
jgi:ribosomal protein S18 acetylase RimI-like enzyme